MKSLKVTVLAALLLCAVVAAVSCGGSGDGEETSASTSASGDAATTSVMTKVTEPESTVPETSVQTDATPVETEPETTSMQGLSENDPISLRDDTTVIVPPKAICYYTVFGAGERILKIDNKNVIVIYGGMEYTPDENGHLELEIAPSDLREPAKFQIRNTSDNMLEVTLDFESKPGSNENPYIISAPNEEIKAIVASDFTVYYTWKAQKTGILMVTSETETNNIAMTNLNTYATTETNAGAYCHYLAVNAGDEIKITVASESKADFSEVIFAIQEFAGTVEEPVPMLLHKASFRIPAGATYHYTYSIADKTLVVEGKNIKLNVGGQDYTPDENGKIEVVPADEIGDKVTFSVTNLAEESVSVSLEITENAPES